MTALKNNTKISLDSPTTHENIPFTVNALNEICRESLTTPFDGKLIRLEGFYQTGKGQDYNGVYYDFFQDEGKNGKITLVVPKTIREYLESRQYYVFEGYLNKSLGKLNDGTIQLLFRVIKLKERKDELQFITRDEYNIVQERFNRPIPDTEKLLLDSILNGGLPKIKIITGKGSIVPHDMYSELKNSEFFEIHEDKVNLSDPTSVLAQIEDTSDSFDLIAVIRGGGGGLEVFNDVDLCRAALSCKTVFATAIGHKKDLTLLEKVADKGFATPTALGIFLQGIVEKYRSVIKERASYEGIIADLKKVIADGNDKLSKAETDKNMEVQRERSDRDRTREFFVNRERKLVYAVLALLFLLLVCLLIIFV